jgi:hypothetical protein
VTHRLATHTRTTPIACKTIAQTSDKKLLSDNLNKIPN